jgi:type IV pilus assembly protein PilA
MSTLLRNLWKSVFQRTKSKEGGFTLVELLVVVGIVVGLAAVVIPSVTQFSGKGDEGSRAAEVANVQTAFDTAMADEGVTSITGINDGLTTAKNDFSAAAVGTVFVTAYLRENPTNQYYCYDSAGIVINETGGSALTASTACPAVAY